MALNNKVCHLFELIAIQIKLNEREP